MHELGPLLAPQLLGIHPKRHARYAPLLQRLRDNGAVEQEGQGKIFDADQEVGPLAH